jgi:hypothetical protein
MNVYLKLIIIDNGVRVVNFYFSIANFQRHTLPIPQYSKYTRTSPDGNAELDTLCLHR